MHAIAQTATALLKTTPNGAVLDDDGVDRLVAAFSAAYDKGEAFEAAGALMATATVWLATDGASGAARTLFAFLLALHPALARIDEARAASLRTEAETQAARFAAFSGNTSATADKVLDGAAPRPAGTTRASPLARFALLGQTAVKTTKQEPE